MEQLERDGRAVLREAEGGVFWGAVLLVFLTFQLSSSLFVLVLMWCCCAGVITCYVCFRVLPRAPSFLLHLLRRPDRSSQRVAAPSSRSCLVCSQPDCLRHSYKDRAMLHTWDGLTVPATVDIALSEFMEIVLQKFVYSWHRRIVPASEALEDELRVYTRHVAAAVLRRAQTLDVPALVTDKMLKAFAAHLSIYMSVRRKLPVDAELGCIQLAVMKEYGNDTHVAMRGRHGDLRYFRHLTDALLPLLLPKHDLKSGVMRKFIRELFAARVFVPAMNFTAKPDFLNKLLLIAFDPHSRLEKMFGPPSKEVPLLAKFACRRGGHPRPLEIPLKQLLTEQSTLYSFMNFMKTQNALHILQIYLSLSNMKDMLVRVQDSDAEKLVRQMTELHANYFQPSAGNRVTLDPTLVQLLASVLQSEEPPQLKCGRIKALNICGRLRGEIYNDLLMNFYYPKFHQHHSFLEHHLGCVDEGVSGEGVTSEGGRKVEKWRQRTRKLVTAPSMDDVSNTETSDVESEGGRDSPALAAGKSPPSTLLSVPCHVQIIDSETITDVGLRPYTVFVILTRRESEENRQVTVRRRFKEFEGLDMKLRQFYGDVDAQLPSKRTFRTLDPVFVDIRVRELQQYLQKLMKQEGIRDSQVLANFLGDSSDPMLFIPDTLGDRAGKMIKSAPVKQKREKQYVEELIQLLLTSIQPASTQASAAAVSELSTAAEARKGLVEDYLADMDSALSSSSSSNPSQDRYWQQVKERGGSLRLNGVLDFVTYLAVEVYRVPPAHQTLLLLAKLLGQNTVEAYAHHFIASRVELMVWEGKVVDLINLLRDNLFCNVSPPRSAEDMRERLEATVERLMHYSPLLSAAVGGDRYSEGTALLIESLQCRELNKLLFFKLLDIILLELFPELLCSVSQS